MLVINQDTTHNTFKKGIMKSIKRFQLIIIGLAAGFCATTGPIRALETEPLQPSDAWASIEGKITVEGSGIPVAGAFISVVEKQQYWNYAVLTDEAGRYKLNHLTAGEYRLYVQPVPRANGDLYIYCDLASRISGTVCSEFYNNKLNGAEGDFIKLYARETIKDFDISLSQGVIISGVVTDQNTMQPIAGVPVTPISSDDVNIAFYTAFTDANGVYTLNLPRGNYKLRFAYHEGYIGEYFSKRGQLKDAEIIHATQSVTNVNTTMSRGGQITGMVTFAGTGNPWLPYVQLIPLDNPNDWDYPHYSFTDQQGVYTFTVPSGRYAIRFKHALDYAGEYYNNQDQATNATPISITAPNTITHIDATLDVGGIITGRLKTAPVGFLSGPLANIELIEADTGLVVNGAESRDGYYEIHSIQTGRYKLRFNTLTLDANGNSECILTRYYPEAGTFEGGTVIEVVRPKVTANIDATIYPCNIYLQTWLPLVIRR